MLKVGGFRSAALHLSAIRREHMKQGFAWTSDLDVEFKDGIRSCLRGAGPPLRADPLPLEKVVGMNLVLPLVKDGPVHP
eukprot:706842-Amphidinium_carterae.1